MIHITYLISYITVGITVSYINIYIIVTLILESPGFEK
jgi:hypothetical protein